jgi:3-hydroxybutyryl-CoA dehydrogenase
MDQVKTVCVCGAGTMGSGIAQVCVTAGYQTILYDVDEMAVKKAKADIENGLQKLFFKQKIFQQEYEQVLQRIEFTSDIKDCIASFIIEAIIEKPEAKISLFDQLEYHNSDSEIIFASNTSSLSLTKIASALKNPGKLIGLHFFNPAPVMKLVEVVTTDYTKQETVQHVLSFVKSLNKISVICKDSPGFIVNRVARPYYIESLRLIEEGKATYENVDKLLEARGFKMGPFKLMDVIGNDINYAVSCSLYNQLNNPERLMPSKIQKEKVEKNELGKKTGSGYYQYNS